LKDRTEWHAWLEEKYDKEKDIWLLFPKKGLGKSRIEYNDAVEEALSFGWIDSLSKGLMRTFPLRSFLAEIPIAYTHKLISKGPGC
jgi:uncharacterized protein YdeI (YjbR/CyaY-like superfamily)